MVLAAVLRAGACDGDLCRMQSLNVEGCFWCQSGQSRIDLGIALAGSLPIIYMANFRFHGAGYEDPAVLLSWASQAS